MTDQKPCLPGCLPGCQWRPPFFFKLDHDHGCLSAEPAPETCPKCEGPLKPTFFERGTGMSCDEGCTEIQPAPKVEHGRLCGCAQCWRESYEAQIPKPAPTPAPASVTPASDEEIAVARPLGYMCIGCDPKDPPETHGTACIFAMEPKLIARIERDRAEIAQLRARLAEVKAATRRVNMAAFDLYSDILPAVKALEAILAKGDK